MAEQILQKYEFPTFFLSCIIGTNFKEQQTSVKMIGCFKMLVHLTGRACGYSVFNYPTLLRSAMAGHLYKHHSKHTSNSGFDLTFMPCSCYILFAAEQRAGYQQSWVDPQREVNCP